MTQGTAETNGDDLALQMAAQGPNPLDVQAKVPHPMVSTSLVPKERYLSREFFELEKQHLWTHTWQMAARLEEIPEPGEYVEYEIAGNSILIVRQHDGSVRALHNVCRHRATQLAEGRGCFERGNIVCPFHGWSWTIDGASAYVFMSEMFQPEDVQPEEVRLQECRVEVWAGMVWINLDPAAPPLSEALAPIAEIVDAVGLGNMRVKWWKQVVLRANWKIAQEAFLELYHAPQTHPQLMMGAGREQAAHLTGNTEYHAYRGGHGRFHAGKVRSANMNGDAFIEASRLLADGQDAMVLDGDVRIFEGIRNKVGVDDPNFIPAAIQALYDHAEGAGIPMAPQSHKLQWGGMLFLFPNFFVLPMYANSLCYRMRPHQDDPECVLFDLWSLTTYPVGREPARAELKGVYDKEDAEHWGIIPRQDFGNIERQQRGLHSTSLTHLRLSPVLERTIVNMHEEIDRVIAAHRVAPLEPNLASPSN